jgi:hypothetical protein
MAVHRMKYRRNSNVLEEPALMRAGSSSYIVACQAFSSGVNGYRRMVHDVANQMYVAFD